MRIRDASLAVLAVCGWLPGMALMLLCACSQGNAPQSVDAGIVDARWICGDLVQQPVPPDCSAGPTTCILPDHFGMHSGGRLKLKWLVGAAGDRLFDGIHDTTLGADCSIEQWPTEETLSCVPHPKEFHVYADAQCRVPLLKTATRHYIPTGAEIRMFDPGPVHPQPAYGLGIDFMTGIEHCWTISWPREQPPLYQALPAGSLDLTSLVEMSHTIGPQSATLSMGAVTGTDGSLITRGFLDGPWGRRAPLAIDRARDQPCGHVADRCLPVDAWPMDRLDEPHAACQTCEGTQLGEYGSSVTSFQREASRYATANCSSTSRPDFRVTLVAAVQHCTADASSCGCEPGGRLVEYEAPERFPVMRRVLASGARLRTPALTDGQGYCQGLWNPVEPNDPGAFDAALGVFCMPVMTGDGLRCVPSSEHLATNIFQAFRDSTCMEPIRVAMSVYNDPVLAWDRIANEYYSLGQQGTSEFYALRPSGCTKAALYGEPWWELGARAETNLELLSAVTE